MNQRKQDNSIADLDDIGCNTANNPSFESVLASRLSRRQALRGGVASAIGAMLGSLGVPAHGGTARVTTPPLATKTDATLLGFTAVAKSLADAVVVPPGYTASVLYALGDPLTAGTPAYRNDGSDIHFENRAGDHHDGMEYFGLSAAGKPDPGNNDRALLAVNHEAITQQFLHANGASANPRPKAEADKEVAAHGVSIVEIRKNKGVFSTVRNSAFNRRITPHSTVQISGAARNSTLLRTAYSADGSITRGTINNCGTGRTPWGTLLTAEENFNGYFARAAGDDAARGDKSVVALNRYGRKQGSTGRHGWETVANAEPWLRFNISKTGVSADGSDDYRNELNNFGYMVEIDPYDKAAPIKKRTSMGRFAHESAAFGRLTAGAPLAAYMGDDAQGEYIYKFVSSANWDAADANPANRMTTGDKYLDSGKLYAAKFNSDGSGQWIELDIANLAIANDSTYNFADQADVLINARLAADAAGATKMDRPEWCGVHPVTGEIYYTLTNNTARRLQPGARQFALDAANPRAYTDPYTPTATRPSKTSTSGNANGHIIRVSEEGGNHAATAFQWDVYLFGAQSDADPAKINLSSLTSDQDFSSPDGLVFSAATGLCWIQTDDGNYTDTSNCMMLAAIPGVRGDGSTRTINYTGADNSVTSIRTLAGAAASPGNLKRFLVGPVDCEITGLCETPDGKTMFVNIQHPGETITKANVTDPGRFPSHWPGSTGYGPGATKARPRSATIMITKNDGGRIGT